MTHRFSWYAYSGMSDRLVNAVTRFCLMSHGGLMIMYRGVSSHSILPIINFSIILPLGSIIMLIITFLFNFIGRHSDVHFIESLPKSFIGMVFRSTSINLYYCKSVKITSVTTAVYRWNQTCRERDTYLLPFGLSLHEFVCMCFPDIKKIWARYVYK